MMPAIDLFANRKEVFLRPGDFHFGSADTRIRTVLGSCVSMVMWHPQLAVGGMSHALLPWRHGNSASFDGRYVDEAWQLFLHHIGKTGRPVNEYHAMLFGGGNMFPIQFKDEGGCGDRCNNCESCGTTVGCRNCRALREIADNEGLNVVQQHLGGVGHRTLLFDIGTGGIICKQITPVSPQEI